MSGRHTVHSFLLRLRPTHGQYHRKTEKRKENPEERKTEEKKGSRMRFDCSEGGGVHGSLPIDGCGYAISSGGRVGSVRERMRLVPGKRDPEQCVRAS